MPKKGQRHNDAGERRKQQRKPSNKAQPVITGNYKKRETYAERAREGLHPEPLPQFARTDRRRKLKVSPGTRVSEPRSGRSGSDSNASSGTRGH